MNEEEMKLLGSKMSAEDMRVLFTEYRDKRVGKFEGSTKRREKDLKNCEKKFSSRPF